MRKEPDKNAGRRERPCHFASQVGRPPATASRNPREENLPLNDELGVLATVVKLEVGANGMPPGRAVNAHRT